MTRKVGRILILRLPRKIRCSWRHVGVNGEIYASYVPPVCDRISRRTFQQLLHLLFHTVLFLHKHFRCKKNTEKHIDGSDLLEKPPSCRSTDVCHLCGFHSLELWLFTASPCQHPAVRNVHHGISKHHNPCLLRFFC